MNPITRRTFSLAAAGAGLGATGLVTSAWAAAPDLPVQGPAPEWVGLENWFNSAPLTLAALSGKVVLVNFWTFGCYNCVNTLPYVVGWYERYKARGLEIVGVHTPEFAYEKSPANVEAALKRHKIRHPVAMDNRFATWKAYNNQYWPAFYLVDRQGKVRRQQVGEGQYAEMEAAIQALLG